MKKDGMISPTKKNVNDSLFKCGECLHFQVRSHPSHGKPCKELGVRAVGSAPPCYTPDVTQLSGNVETFVSLAGILSSYSPKQKRILLGLLNTKQKTKMEIGTKVYFLALGKDYVSNYLSGFVFGTTSFGELIISGSPDQKSVGKSYIAYFTDDAELMTRSAWKAKRAELESKGRIQDPKTKTIKKSVIADYEPPSIDSAPTEWHDKQERRKKKRNSELVFNAS